MIDNTELKKAQLILDSQPNIVIVTNGNKLVNVNKTFLTFFQVDSLDQFLEKHNCICDLFINDSESTYLSKEYSDGQNWIDIILNNKDINHKAMLLNQNDENTIFDVKGKKLIDNDYDYEQEVVIFTDVTELEYQARRLNNLEIPLLEINDTTTLIPLIGILDSTKSQKLMENILYTIKDKAIKNAIIDIKGILIVDSAVSAHLLKIVKASKLMGCRVILSGISPEVAQSIVNLGLNLDDMLTTSNLKDALNLANDKF